MLKKVTLDRANRRKDRSVSLTFITSLEESSSGFMEIDEEINTSGVLYYKSSGELTQKEVDEIDNADLEVEGKTKSQRLRNVLYVLYEQTTGQKDAEGFKDFYSNKMEQMIEHFKDKLDA